MKTLLLDNEQFFPDLIEEVKKSKWFVVIDSYIWINDKVGCELAGALLEAADRGVKVYIRNDVFGAFFEHNHLQTPMFEDDILNNVFWRGIYSRKNGFLNMRNFMRFGFLVYGFGWRPELRGAELGKKLVEHENVEVDTHCFFNHGKIVVIDGELVYFPGQCISDDYEVWKDYAKKVVCGDFTKKVMAEMCGNSAFDQNEVNLFVQNDEECVESVYDFLDDFIVTAEGDLHIQMAYLGMRYVKSILKALNKGVNVYLLTTAVADTNNNTNLHFLAELLKAGGGSDCLHLAVYDQQAIHSKVLVTRDKVTVGSANFHGTLGYKFDVNEQNFFSRDPGIAGKVFERMESDFKKGKLIKKLEDLSPYSKTKMRVEQLFVVLNSILPLIFRKRVQGYREKSKKKLEKIFDLK